MKIFGKHAVMKVDRQGENFILRNCGYPLHEHMDKWDWKDFYAGHEGNIFVDEHDMLELEFKLNNIHAKDLNPVFRYDARKDFFAGDDMYDEYLNYLDMLNWANEADRLLDEFHNK